MSKGEVEQRLGRGSLQVTETARVGSRYRLYVHQGTLRVFTLITASTWMDGWMDVREVQWRGGKVWHEDRINKGYEAKIYTQTTFYINAQSHLLCHPALLPAVSYRVEE